MANPIDISGVLTRLAAAPGFPDHPAATVDQWMRAGVKEEAIEPILRFMERHPDLDFGMPGHLVHFLEGLADEANSPGSRPRCCAGRRRTRRG